MNNLKKGQKFELSFTSRFGKKITDIKSGPFIFEKVMVTHIINLN